METLYLSRSNLLALLSKLDRKAKGVNTSCAIVKFQMPNDPYVNTMDICFVHALEDEELYTNRERGIMSPLDEIIIAKNKGGI